jgi:hypothetical protein
MSNTIDIDERKIARSGASLWLGWTLATTAGMLAGFIPPALLFDALDLGLARVLVPILAGLFVGFFQWLVLRQYLVDSQDWIFSGGAAWAAGYAAGLLVVEAMRGTGFLGGLLAYILFGIIIGVFQWPVLRREIPNIVPWVLANVVGWGLGALISQFVVYSLVAEADIAASAGYQAITSGAATGLTGLVAGAITGLAFVWIVRQPERAAGGRM